MVYWCFFYRELFYVIEDGWCETDPKLQDQSARAVIKLKATTN